MTRSSLVLASGVVAERGGPDLACRPCYNEREYAVCTNNICMISISVETVMGHVAALVERAKP
jgi:hypothetical protein